METQKITPSKFGMNYGLYLGGLMVIISILMYATDMALEGTQWPVYLYYIAFPVIILFAISKYKKLNANALSLGEALKLGLIIALISALVYVAYIFIFNYLIDTEFHNKMSELVREHCLDAVKHVVSTMHDESLSPKVRMVAAVEILNRGLGRPVDLQMHLTMQAGSELKDVNAMSDSELEALARTLTPTHQNKPDIDIIDAEFTET